MGFHWETDTPQEQDSPDSKKDKTKVPDPAEKKKVDVHPVVTPEEKPKK